MTRNDYKLSCVAKSIKKDSEVGFAMESWLMTFSSGCPIKIRQTRLEEAVVIQTKNKEGTDTQGWALPR
jgi:hypothetical protein